MCSAPLHIKHHTNISISICIRPYECSIPITSTSFIVCSSTVTRYYTSVSSWPWLPTDLHGIMRIAEYRWNNGRCELWFCREWERKIFARRSRKRKRKLFEGELEVNMIHFELNENRNNCFFWNWIYYHWVGVFNSSTGNQYSYRLKRHRLWATRLKVTQRRIWRKQLSAL